MNVTIEEQDGNMVAFLEGILDTAAATETDRSCEEFETIMNNGEEAEGKEYDTDDVLTHQIAEARNADADAGHDAAAKRCNKIFHVLDK